MKPKNSRRRFIKNTALLGVGLPFLCHQMLSCESKNKEENNQNVIGKKGLNILILGGTSFLGPHQIAYAISRGHSISTFTRGKTKPTIHTKVLSEVEQLIGDRASNLSALENRTWDVVIDNSGHHAEWTKKSATLLKDKVDMYVYTSSTGVYYPYLGDYISEDTKLLLTEPEGIEDEEMKMEYWYGVMKANSEADTINAFSKDRSIIIRPTYMMGPGDTSDRFIYWPLRLSKGGDIMVPGKELDPVQYIDVRDVAEWTIRLAEQKLAGTYNAVGPKNTQTMKEFVLDAKEAFPVDSKLVYIDDFTFLKKQKITQLVPWIMPEGNNYGSARTVNQKALQNGLTLRNLKESVIETYNWWNSDALTDERRQKFELNPDSMLVKEKSILEAWKSYNNMS
ncbi:NAD-dependent epimerase/dehydratase family protein [Formosa maritima]|uniref:NAD-dependent epimerase/dehydratase family protein n=1 Tax=Formosa maritima TaxID=2592046 RepID=A0A5D0GEE9_9FLAO|nr:NAD-dependent epimerase/dehydratase family protein [Formosa maritima]TYA56689.1 NAD-dependent epimerase/dehydratase family protein [Formosa maritima]